MQNRDLVLHPNQVLVQHIQHKKLFYISLLNTVLWWLVGKISCTVRKFNPLLKWANSIYYVINATKTTEKHYKFFSETATNKTQWAWGGAGFIPMTFTLGMHVQSCHCVCLKTDFSTGLTVTSLSSEFVIKQAKQIKHYQFSEILQLWENYCLFPHYICFHETIAWKLKQLRYWDTMNLVIFPSFYLLCIWAAYEARGSGENLTLI